MVLHKRLDYVYSGCQVPPMPHLSGSAKGKRSVRKKVDDNPMFAFDLLATVAGKILEREKSAIPFNTGLFSLTNSEDSFKPETSDKEKPLKVEAFDCRCYNNSTLGFDGAFRGQANFTSGELPPSPSTFSGHASVLPKSEASDKVAFAGKPTINGRKTGPDKCSTGRCSLGPMESHECKVDVGIKTPDFLHLNSGIEVPQFGGGIARNSSIPKCGDGTELAVDRDDDENSSGCTHRSTIVSKAFRPQRIGDRRIRKLLGSKFWKVAPTKMDGELSDTERKPVCRGRKMCYTQIKAQRCSFKRRKLSEHRTVSSFDGREGTSKPPVKSSIKVEASYSHAKSYGVRFSIKSFKVPELVIEMPETATVGSLRRTVMETVTTILEGGLHVGVFLHGKKVKDDNKTLLQAGLSLDDDIGNVGFMLEPNPTGQPPPSPTNPADPQSLVCCDSTEAPTRIPAAFSPSDQGTSNTTLQPPVTNVGSFPESDYDSVHSPTDASANSKDLVSLPSVSIDALDVVPLRKSQQSDLVQRRIRRPFSVSEVESLVQAVEKLGTGRWRDVKLRSFDNAKHRTYVDLKDKWKTLVHTAKISPQQRRGEPVPQELLDRVLGAHSYWAQQLTKLQPKSPPIEAHL